MAFRLSGIDNFIKDKKYSDEDIAAITARAKGAAEQFEAGGNMFSGGEIAHVLGNEERVKDYMETRETNLERYT